MRITVAFLLASLFLLAALPTLAAHPDVTIKMMAQNNSGENGTATLSDLNGKTRVVIHLTHEKLTGDQPAHIHPGSCAKLNPAPKYVLKNVVLGHSNTVVEVPMTALLGGHYAINVHESKKQIAVYVSCGTIP
jgi:hypothetical protein